MLPQREIESRIGVAPLDQLQEERSVLVAKVAPLRAMFGMFGGFDPRRKVLLSIATLRQRNEAGEKKPTDKVLDAMAHADEMYTDWLDHTEVARGEWIVLEDQIAILTERIQRDNALIRYVTSEPR